MFFKGNSIYKKKRKKAKDYFEKAQLDEFVGKRDDAFDNLEKTRSICHELGEVCMEAYTWIFQARIFRLNGEYKQALNCIEKANGLLKDIPDSWSKKYVLGWQEYVWGTLCQKIELIPVLKEAEKHFQNSIDLVECCKHEVKQNWNSVHPGFLVSKDKGTLYLELINSINVNKINLAEMFLFLHQGQEGCKKAEDFACAVDKAGRRIGDDKLRGAAARIRGEIAERREDLEGACKWHIQAKSYYQRFGLSEGLASVENALRRIDTLRRIERWRQLGKPDLYPESEQVPKKIVLQDHPFLRNIEKRASTMPSSQAWKIYLEAAFYWDDAGYKDCSYDYLKKIIECFDRMYTTTPFQGTQYPSEARTMLRKKIQFVYEWIISLLLSSEASKLGIENPKAEAFYYREKLGPIGLLDELVNSGIANILIAEHAEQTGRKELLDKIRQFDGISGYDFSTQEIERDQYITVKNILGERYELQDLLSGDISDLHTTQQLLTLKEILIEYILTDSLFGIFVITKDSITVLVFKTLITGKKESSLNPIEIIINKIKKYCLSLEPEIDKDGNPIPKERNIDRVKEQSQWLYNKLLRLTEDKWFRDGKATKDRLIIIPQGVLHHLPFCALYDGDKFLCEKIPSVQMPSASVFKYAYSKRPSQYQQVSYFGLANPKDDLPGCERAVKSAVDSLGATQYWREDCIEDKHKKVIAVRRGMATQNALLAYAQNSTIVDLETHGYLSENNSLEDGFCVLGDNGKPSLFTAHDVFLKLRLQAELLITAICYGGRMKIDTGDELMGLIRAFLFAGARSILTYPWVLHDEGAGEFIRRFYNKLINNNQIVTAKDIALKKVQTSFIEEGREGKGFDEISLEHPYYWAWVLIGDHI